MSEKDYFKGVLGIDEIIKLMPYRYPMLMLDRVLEMKRDEYAVAQKNVSYGEVYFQGHFPENAVMPGVLIIEATAQTSVVLWNYFYPEKKEGKVIYLSSLDRVRFRRPVIPGDVLQLRVDFQRRVRNIWKFKGLATVDGDVAAEILFTAALIDLRERS